MTYTVTYTQTWSDDGEVTARLVDTVRNRGGPYKHTFWPPVIGGPMGKLVGKVAQTMVKMILGMGKVGGNLYKIVEMVNCKCGRKI